MIGVNRPGWRRIAVVIRGVVGFKAVWLCTVLGAANQTVWLGPAALVIFAAVQLLFSSYRRREVLVLACGLAMGIALGAASGAAVAFYVLVGFFYAAATPLLVEMGGALKGGEAAPGGRKLPGAT